MIAAPLLLLAASLEEPKEALEKLMNHYHSLSSYAATIECHDASGLFPGNYIEGIRWLRPSRFEITLLKKSDYAAKEGSPGLAASEFYCDGKSVVVVDANGSRATRSFEVGPNTMPGWEVEGGLVLGFLLDSLGGKFLLDPPKSAKLTYSWGTKPEWEGQKVREICLTIGFDNDSRTLPISLFLDEQGIALVGQEYSEGGRRHWMKYSAAKENPTLPSTLGDPPKL